MGDERGQKETIELTATQELGTEGFRKRGFISE